MFQVQENQPNGLELRHHCEIQPTLDKHKLPVVCVRDACKHYGTKRKPIVVLDGLNMTVPKGVIYGLLGASGCGKTTLLSSILGQRQLDSGKIWVLGGPPGTRNSGVPGRRIGYMPQETSLYGDFTIHETFVYFGWINGMTRKQIEERFEMLTKLFMLPDTGQRVKSLSGGEQRRVSLASVLLHQPELLILDEPTVGVDPLLRENIWSHLLYICREEKTTIIITTHYIEEARQANIVGLMRKGVLLAEEAPEVLLTKHETNTLGEVFLKLSISQNMVRRQSINVQNVTDSPLAVTPICNSTNELIQESVNDIPEIFTLTNKKDPFRISDYLLLLKGNHMKALIWKSVLWWVRNGATLGFVLALSIFLTISFFMCIGGDPHDLSVAVVNYETNNSADCRHTLTCNGTQLSCGYLHYLKKHSVILTYIDSEDEAKKSVLQGKYYASIVVRHNYSDALRARISDWPATNRWNIKFAAIHVFRDTANNLVANYLKVRMYDSFQSFIEEYLISCDYDPKFISIPIQFKDPVYGEKYPKFINFVLPGALLSLSFLLAVLLTASAMLIERNEASLERTFTMGITETELLMAHVVCECVVMVLQTLAAIATAFLLFDVAHKGSLTLVILLTLLTGFCGMSYGLFISCFCDSLLTVNLLTIGTFFPTILLSGIVWPVQSMHRFLKPLTIVFPLTTPGEGLRSILQKSWGLYSEEVYMSFVIVGLWTIIFLTLSVILLKFKKG